MNPPIPLSHSISTVLAVALALSIGWGIRGNYGHEIGAMVPGALAAMAAVLCLGRADWQRRIHHFGFFGALGWSFGGSMSYMQVIAYTHSGHWPTVLYGYGSLFVIGFLWAAIGGAGTALPALLNRATLAEFFPPLIAVFSAWLLQDVAEAALVQARPEFRHESPLYWYDTDWLAALTAIAAILLLALLRRRLDAASALILHMALGWWAGFLSLVVALGWRMTPPRGDNWAGCLGMVVGMLLFFIRQGWHRAAVVSLTAGFWGGIGFAGAAMLKLVGIKTGWQTNWHSVLEQTYGFINGIGIFIAMRQLAATAPPPGEEGGERRWTESFALGGVLLGVLFLNLKKNPEDWVKAKAVPEMMYGLSAFAWFCLGSMLVAAAFAVLLAVHRRRPLALLPAGWLGRGQLLFVLFLWCMVIGNLARAVAAFVPQRLVTEGVIHLNAVICTVLVLTAANVAPKILPRALPSFRRMSVAGVAAAAAVVVSCWAVTWLVWGENPAGHASKHIRFGPNATATKEKPKSGQLHP